jgi:hypothetical protein
VIRAMTTIPAPALEHVFDARILVAVPSHSPFDSSGRLTRKSETSRITRPSGRRRPPRVMTESDCPLVRGKP